jgi:hypothetical protein
MSFHAPNQYRVRTGRLASDDNDGNNGLFFIPSRRHGVPLKVICSDGEGWEHVSVSFPDRCPTWEEMCTIKHLFWDDTDTVVQFHPPRAEYVNNHRFCLHMWRPTGQQIGTPPGWMVGYADVGVLA